MRCPSPDRPEEGLSLSEARLDASERAVPVATAFRQARRFLGANGKRLLLPLLLAGCGSAAQLQPAPGSHLPVAPRGAREVPSADDLLTPSTQQRPLRNDELLKGADPRSPDDFDLTPS